MSLHLPPMFATRTEEHRWHFFTIYLCLLSRFCALHAEQVQLCSTFHRLFT